MIARYDALAVFLVLTCGLAADDKKDDRGSLQGEWAAVVIEVGGKKLTAEEIKNSKIAFKGDEVATNGDVNPKSGKPTFKLRPNKSPKEIDFVVPNAGVVKGIYKLEGGTLTICSAESTKSERPKEFKAADGVVLRVYKRAEK